ncbi:hypothetical protein BDZ88DRAFT_419478 [Geranomyces variabilis]|nr:hypothetical protein BDZ88DRAFT_419478 [Geranomyces variabilis]
MSTDQIGACEADFILKYHMYQEQPTEHDERILLAVPKTYANHIWFMQRQGPGQQALARLLTAFANHDPATTAAALDGPKNSSTSTAALIPTPGLAAIAATLLTVMEEERAFIALVHLFYTPSSGKRHGGGGSGGNAGSATTTNNNSNNNASTFYNGRGLFAPRAANTKAVRRALAAGSPVLDPEIRAVHDALVATHVHPRVVARLRELGIGTADYAAGWYAGLFLALCRLDAPPRRRVDFDHDDDDDDHNDDEDENNKFDDDEAGNASDSDRMDVDSYYAGQRRSGGEPMDVDGGTASSDDGAEKGKRWDGLLGFATVVRCWDFYAEVGWEGACVVAAAVIKWHEATLLSLPAEAVLPFLRGTGGARPSDGGGSDEDEGTLSSSPSLSSFPSTLAPHVRAAIRAVPAPDADRFMRLVRRMWDAR